MRVSPFKPDQELDELVEELSKIKPRSDQETKKVKELVNKIKELLIKSQQTTYNSNGYSVTLQKRVQKSFDEPALIAYAKEHGLDIIKTVEQIDTDALETAVYNGLISPADIEPFEVIKETMSLITK